MKRNLQKIIAGFLVLLLVSGAFLTLPPKKSLAQAPTLLEQQISGLALGETVLGIKGVANCTDFGDKIKDLFKFPLKDLLKITIAKKAAKETKKQKEIVKKAYDKVVDLQSIITKYGTDIASCVLGKECQELVVQGKSFLSEAKAQQEIASEAAKKATKAFSPALPYLGSNLPAAAQAATEAWQNYQEALTKEGLILGIIAAVEAAIKAATKGADTLDNSVPISSDQQREGHAETQKNVSEVNLLNEMVKETLEKETNPELENINAKENCLDPLAYGISKLALRGITINLVNWINNGFPGGGSFIVKDLRTVFQDMYKQEIYRLSDIFKDSKKYPFGQIVIERLANSVKQGFANNAEYTLPDFVTNSDPQLFNNNFAAGGWDAWLALTQLPQNNPIGFSFISAEEFARRAPSPENFNLSNILKKQLDWSGGFLDFKKCIDPPGYVYIQGKDNDGDGSPDYYDKCRQYATATPGQVIANQLNLNLGSSTRQLELADEMNESLGAIFGDVTKHIYDKGISEFDASTCKDEEGKPC